MTKYKYYAGQIWKRIDNGERLKILKIEGTKLWFVWLSDQQIQYDNLNGYWHDENHAGFNKNRNFRTTYKLEKLSIIREILKNTEEKKQ